MVDTLQMSKLTECTTPRVNLNVNYGLWVMMMSVMGEAVCWGLQGGIWEISVPSSQLCYKLETVLKK